MEYKFRMLKVASGKEGWINNYRKPFLITAMIIFMALWLFTEPPFSISEQFEDFSRLMGSVFLGIGIIGRVYSSLTISASKSVRIVSTEMYSVVRHPLYFFSFFIVLGAGLLIARIDLLLYLAAAYTMCFYPMIINEESHLAQKFGSEYADYAKRTPRIVPDFSKWHAREKMEIDTRFVTKTMLDAGLALLIIPIIATVDYLRWLFGA